MVRMTDRIDSAPRAVRALVRLADEDFEQRGLADVEALLVWGEAAGETVMTRDADGE